MKTLLLGSNGYIGSCFNSQSTADITAVDLCLFDRNLGLSTGENYHNYCDLHLHKFDVIICLAGHSSVPMCENSPDRSWTNNVEYFRHLCHRLSRDQKLIYASSASVYGATPGLSYETSQINFNVINHYDLQKITIDLIANKFIAEGKNIVGLRFGTVNGVSKNTRGDLIINAMTRSALTQGKIFVKNPQIRRAILGINDLCRALNQLITQTVPCGQYNMASFNTSVEAIAVKVAEVTGAEIKNMGNDAQSYDFELNTDKFCQSLSFTFTDTLDSLIKDLVNNFHQTNWDIRNDDRNFQFYLS